MGRWKGEGRKEDVVTTGGAWIVYRRGLSGARARDCIITLIAGAALAVQ
jgi:predicted type IV restriction endonuclease